MSIKRTKWIRWLRAIRAELEALLAWRNAYEETMLVIERLDTPVMLRARALLQDTYAHAMAMGVRRQLKPGSRNVTLAGLLADIGAHPRATNLASSASAAARRDVDNLRHATSRVVAFADRAVAHADRRGSRLIAPDDLHLALAALIHTHDRYAEMLGCPPIDETALM